ncbi:MAG: Hpt domain-containing protein [Flavobacteriales bacterium]|nr:Hpt domain-containing protein [Flavobacteriales bacterium]
MDNAFQQGPVMPVTDLSYLNDLSGGDPAFVVEMIDLFNDKIPEYLQQLENHMLKQDWQEVKALAHTIKPNIDYMGIDNLKEVVRRIEKLAGEETETEEIPALLSKMKEVCSEAIQELRVEADKLR